MEHSRLTWIAIKKISLLALCCIIGFSLKNIPADYGRAAHKGRYARANRLLPDFQYLIGIPNNGQDIDRRQLSRFTKYYEFIASFNPEQSGAYDILGLCYYHLGLPEKAIKAYQKAAELNPHFFWSHYNLGMIYFWEGNFKLSSAEFRKALDVTPQETFAGMSSKIYLQIMIANRLPPRALEAGLVSGYSMAEKYFQVSLKAEKILQNPQEAPSFINGRLKTTQGQPIPLKIF